MSGLNKNMSEMTLEDRERRALEFKNQGNAALASNNAPEAIRCYTEAIAWEPTNKIYWSNRSAAFMMIGNLQAALEDGERCISLVKHWAKGYSRKGAALQAMGKYTEAAETLSKGLSMEPGNNMLTEALAQAKASIKANPASAKSDSANPPPAGADGETAEPSHMTDPVIGIDLGTTYSCVAVWDGDEGVKIIADEEGNRTTPSVVGFAAEGQRLVGKAAQRQAASNYANTVYDIKRVLGSRVSDTEVAKDIARFPFKVIAGDGDKPVVIVNPEGGAEERFHPEEVSAMVLTRMKTIAENFLGRPVGRAVVTVPAYFNDAQRQATKDAGAIAGLEVMRIINEPTAAALAYGLDRTGDGDKNEAEGPRLILVFDLGGGTFDVSVLSIDGGIFEVVATAGDTHLGGEDFDNNLVDFLKSEFERTNAGTDLAESPRALKRLRAAAESAKRQLSSNLTTNVLIDSLYEGIDLSVTLTRAKFEKLNEIFFERCLNTVKHVLKDAKMTQDQIDDVVLVGGSTRIPRVQALLSKYFGGRDLCKSINPDEAVAYGAAVQGAVLGGLRVAATEQLLLVDVTALSLGIELEGKVFSAIIPRNSKVPVVKKKTYTTTEDFQDAVDVMIFEGERQCTDGNNLLGEFKITGIERAKRGVPQVEVAFSLDTNGILNVTACDMVTNSKAEVTLTNNKSRLSGDQIQKMLEDAERFKDADAKRVENVQSRNELETYVYELRSRGRVDCAAACSDVAAWLDMGVPRTTKEYQTRLKELEGIAQGN